MKDDDALPISTPTSFSASSATTTGHSRKESSQSVLFGRGRYKFWALAAILLLAFWSMFTGTVTLRWSAGNLNRFSDDFDIPLHEDLDVLEMEEREKMVKHMWDVYTNSRRIRLPKFWQQAFEAAYEDLTSDEPEVREAAISEIAKMSIRSIHFESPPVHTLVSFFTFISVHWFYQLSTIKFISQCTIN
nr:Aldehyde dehydrogenase [Ipomoea batatas]